MFGGNAYAGIAHLQTQPHLCALLGLYAHGQGDLTTFGELDGVVGKVDEYLAQPQRITHPVAGHLSRHIQHQLQALGGSFVANHIDHAGQHALQLKRLGIELQLARFDFGKIQNVVDHPQQVLASLLNLAHIAHLTGVQTRLQRQVRHTDDGVHGRANFVAHIGQEVAFGPVGGICRLFGGLQGLLRVLLFGNVDERANQATRAAIAVAKAARPVHHGVLASVTEDAHGFFVYREAVADDASVFFCLCGTLVQGHAGVVEHGFAQHAGARLAHGFLKRPVRAKVAALGVFVEHGYRNGVQQRLLEQQLLRHLGL